MFGSGSFMAMVWNKKVASFKTLVFIITLLSTVFYHGSSQEPGSPSQRRFCSLLKDIGPCRNFSVLWYYDHAGAICSRFWYGGCGGNLNRFSNQEDCQSTCIPAADIEEGRSDLNPCYMRQSQSAGPCTNFSIKWMYDVSKSVCRQFYYGGCKGDLNIFDTEVECQRTCINTNAGRSRFRTQSEPIKTTPTIKTSTAQTISGLEICRLNADRGTCTDWKIKWNYSSDTKSCKQFYYGGCGGNNNRFDTRGECEKTCALQTGSVTTPARYIRPKVPSQSVPAHEGYKGDVCELKTDIGRCREYVIKWTYDVHTRSCRRFYYGGCGGNNNRFYTEEDCRNICPRRKLHQRRQENIEIGSPTIIRAVCDLPLNPGTCNQIHLRYYYNMARGKCHPFKFNGCEGNENNFLSRASCDRKCGIFRDQDVCNLPPSRGGCSLSIPMYYYDPQIADCSQFNFSGCQGNGNIFFSQKECIKYCASAKMATTKLAEHYITRTTIAPISGSQSADDLATQGHSAAKYMHFLMLKGNESSQYDFRSTALLNKVFKNYESTTPMPSYMAHGDLDQDPNYNVIA